MYHRWLDEWDERRSLRGEETKDMTRFVLDAPLAFDKATPNSDLSDFCALADQAIDDSDYFYGKTVGVSNCEVTPRLIKFPSPVVTDVEENNEVRVSVTGDLSGGRALVIFHHWNARSRQRQLAKLLSLCGVTVFEIEMPYHFERSRPGSAHADYMLCPSLGRTVQSVRQAVLDGRTLIRCLKREGYREISVLGMSLGSWVAGLVAAHEGLVRKAALFLTAGNLADMVWTGRATRHIRKSLEGDITHSALGSAWGMLNLESYVNRLARSDLELQIVLAKRDTVVLPHLSERFVERLLDAGATPQITRLNCGHYSLALPPYIFAAGLSLMKFLK